MWELGDSQEDWKDLAFELLVKISRIITCTTQHIYRTRVTQLNLRMGNSVEPEESPEELRPSLSGSRRVDFDYRNQSNM